MCPMKKKHRSSVADHAGKCSRSDESTSTTADRISESVHSGSLRHVDLTTGTNGWASPPSDLFSLRGKNYAAKRQKCPAGDYLLTPCGTDWLRSSSKLDNVLGRADNRIASTLWQAQSQGKSMKSFIFVVNLQVLGKDQHSTVFYFAAEAPIPIGSLLYRRDRHGDPVLFLRRTHDDGGGGGLLFFWFLGFLCAEAVLV